MLTFLVILQQLCFTVAYLPQIVKLFKTDESGEISIPYYAIRIVGLLILQAVYVKQGEFLLAFANITGIIFELIILGRVIRNRMFEEIALYVDITGY